MENNKMNYNIHDNLEDHLRDAPDKEIKIINAAINIFSQKGFRNTTTKEIAAEAGIGEGTIFRYFNSKDVILERMTTLLVKILMPKYLKPIKKLIAENENNSVKVLFTAIITDRLQILQANKKFIKALVPELIYHDKILKNYTGKVIPIVKELIARVIEIGVANGEIRHIPTDLAFNQLFGFMLSYYCFDSADSLEKTQEDVSEFVDTFLRGWYLDKSEAIE